MELEEEEEQEERCGSGASDSFGHPGWGFVAALANYLIEHATLAVTDAQADKIIRLYVQLIDYDKELLTYEPTKKSTRLKSSKGRFHIPKNLNKMGDGGVRN